MFSTADGAQLAYIKEAAWGITPATPELTKMRITGESFNLNRETKTSAEINAERGVTDIVPVGGGASGGFDFELSYGAFDDILESLMHSAWVGEVLKNGTTQKSLTFEKKFQTDTSAFSYFRYTGMVANSMNLAISAGEIITGSFDFLGKGGTLGTAILSGETYNEATTKDILSASTHVGTLSLGSFTTPKLLNINLEVNNNLMTASTVASLDYGDIGAGVFSVGGTMEVYFNNNDVYQAFLDATEFAVSMTLGAVTAEKYTFDLPRVQFSSGEIVAGGQNSYIMAKMGFQALQDSVTGKTMSITRKVA